MEEAKNNFDKVTEIDQNDASAYFNKSKTLISPDDFEKIAKNYQIRHWSLTQVIWMQAINTGKVVFWWKSDDLRRHCHQSAEPKGELKSTV